MRTQQCPSKSTGISGTITIRCGVRQGCRISMSLYALCLNPVLRMLVEKLPGIQRGRRARRTAVVAYADDVTIFATSPTGFPVIKEAIWCYERASGACPRKSKALTKKRWSAPETGLGMDFHSRVKILGIAFGRTIVQSFKER